MNKFALAAIGVVAAHPHPHHKKHGGMDFGSDHNISTIDTVSNWIFGEEPVAPKCNLKPEDRMSDTIFYREMIQGIYNSAVKGLYHETSERPISEDCFGDWIDVELSKVEDFGSSIIDDFWTFKLQDAKDAADLMINAHYKNAEACQFQRIADDKKNWCLDNAEKCVGLSSLFENLYGNAPSLISRGMDIYDLMMEDDVCYSDSELISEVERGTFDVSSIISTVWGFDLKWDQTRQVAHIKRSDFKKQIKNKGIGFGDDLALPTLDDAWNIIANFEFPAIGVLVQYVEMALHYIGLD
jgi:hypothetical protein